MGTTTANRVLIQDAWLAKLFGYPVYRVALRSGTVDLNGVAEQLTELADTPIFAYAKVEAQDVSQAQLLERLGFHLVDTNVLLEKPLDRTPPGSTSCAARFAQRDDEESVVAVARTSFALTRFHLDPLIPTRLADTIKAEWARNYFLGTRGDRMIVAVVDQRVVGFNQMLLGQDSALTIDLIAVDEQYRRRGIAAAMIRYAEVELPGVQLVRVGTQLANTGSLRLYESLGFRMARAQYVFHYHGPSAP